MADPNMTITIDLHQWLWPLMTVILPQLSGFVWWLWRLDSKVAKLDGKMETLLALLPAELHGND